MHHAESVDAGGGLGAIVCHGQMSVEDMARLKKENEAMTMEEFEGYAYVEGGVCAARGFVANGMNCGINPDKDKNDLGMVCSEAPCIRRLSIRRTKCRVRPSP